MTRIAVIFLFFILACKPEDKKTQTQQLARQDTTKIEDHEPFDLQVRKLEDPKRQTWQDPKFVIEALGDLNGLTVADIGSGTGYFTFQMAVPAERLLLLILSKDS